MEIGGSGERSGCRPAAHVRRVAHIWPPQIRAHDYALLVTMIIAHDYLNGETIHLDDVLRVAPR